MASALDLSQLHDIHLPTPISWWPLAPGWYVVALGSFSLLCLIIFYGRRYYLAGEAKRQALNLLSTYQKQFDQHEVSASLICARVSQLLRRISLVYFSRVQIASLKGDAWLAFLNTTAKGLDFTNVRYELLELPYQLDARVDDLNPLFSLARRWILALPKRFKATGDTNV